MLEKNPVQQRGFHNVYKDGKAIGFQVRYRSTYYRGVWLSMSTGFDVTVDGEKFPRDQVTVTVGGKTYTQEDDENVGNVQWPNYEAAILTVTQAWRAEARGARGRNCLGAQDVLHPWRD